MASVQWGNSKGGKIKDKGKARAMFYHNDKDRRLEQRHKNIDIDKSKTWMNFSCRGYTGPQLYEEFCSRLENVEVRNSETVLLNRAIVYAPAGMAGDYRRLPDWFRDVFEIAASDKFFGKNVLDMQVDMDETHDYYDPKKKAYVTAREHGHLSIFPEKDGKLNNDKVVTRGMMKKFNDAVHKMTLEKYGVEWNDGTGKNEEDLTVERMKNDTVKAENEMLEGKKATLETACSELEARKEKAEELGSGIGLAMSVVGGARRRHRKETEKADEAEERRKAAEKAADEARAALDAAREAQASEAAAHEKMMAEGRAELEQLRDDVKNARVDVQEARRAREEYEANKTGAATLKAEIDRLERRRDGLRKEVAVLEPQSKAVTDARKAVSRFVVSARSYIPDELKFSPAALAIMRRNAKGNEDGRAAQERSL